MSRTKCQHFQINENCESCQKIKAQWYKKLKGFEDIESSNGNYLNKYAGTAQLHENAFIQLPEEEMQSIWPEAKFKKEEEFLNHPDFGAICESIFKHKNNAISAKLMVNIWTSHCEGLSNREIGTQYNIFYVTIFRAIRRIEELMKIMDIEQPNEKHVIIRNYKEDSDAPFLFATWRKSIWFENKNNTDSIDPIFFRLKTKQIKLILENPHCNVKIACLNDDHDQIVGYSVMIGSEIKFVYVKIEYRKQGIAKLLTRGFIFVSKPETKIGASIVRNHKLRIQGEEDESRRTISEHRDRSKKEA